MLERTPIRLDRKRRSCGLAVREWALLRAGMDLEYQYLVAHLQDAFAADPRVSTLDIKVVATGGRIYLIGEVPTLARREAVDAVVRETAPGVQVRNELTVLELGGVPGPENLSA